MPRSIASLPDGYAIIRQPDGFRLLRRVDARMWAEIAGPYTQRINAVRMAERDAKRHHV